MIQDPIAIAVILLAVVVIAQRWHKRFKNAPVMRILPTPVWCYIPPTLLTTAGILPIESPLYDWISTYVLPGCLILLLMTTDLKTLRKIGKHAVIAFFGSSCAVFVGGVICYFLFKNWIGPESDKAIATLMASWIGGTANQLAVKHATGLSDQLFAPLFISDITMVYVWMTLLMILSGSQKKIDRMINADSKQLEEILHGAREKGPEKKKLTLDTLLKLLILGFGIGILCTWGSRQIPEIGNAVNQATWVIILVTTAGLLLSLTRFARKEEENANQIGYFFFYFVLASTGAKANLLAVFLAPLFLLVAFVWMAIQGILYLLYARALRIPIGLFATSSQANLGGVVSAPIVASTYDSKLVPVALILAIFGNGIGNYVGILTAQLLRLF
ncbi:MAG: DUF819 family protein [Candidatus Omnitrophica bacterium]|nr:DUF819 family protein [Candidatus Omnitrophota bacterium]